jgi:superfamily II DNA or RNA helicase
VTLPGPTLRDWQRRALEAMAEWSEGSFLISAAPGAGKTIPSLVFAAQELRAGRIKRVAVVCPTSPLTRQWARAAARVGLHLLPDAPTLRPPGDFHGVSLTYARVALGAEEYARTCGPGTLVIADEAHHLGEDLAWGAGFATAFRPARRWLLLSGTPFRSDQSPIPGVRYEDGVCVPDVSYTYADAVRDGVCRRITFVPYDGTLQWRSGDDVIETSFDEVLSKREAGRRYRTAISTELPDGLPRILRGAHERLLQVRAAGHPDAGGLVVTADSDHARAVARAMHEIIGAPPTVVLHTDPGAHDKLDAFRRGADPWIVAVNMVSEGVDIPRLRVGVYATVAKTPLIFRQIVGRFVRVIPGRPREAAWVYLPADRELRALAADLESELRHSLRPDDGDRAADEGLLDDELLERAQRRETEPTEEAFVPLKAEVSPQMELFALPAEPAPEPQAPALSPGALAAAEAFGVTPGAPPAPPAPPAPEPAPAPARDDDEPPLSAFERRARLRQERHQLVASLRRIDGRSHAEINAAINRALGIRSVEKATIAELERSIELLHEELAKASRRRRERRAARAR